MTSSFIKNTTNTNITKFLNMIKGFDNKLMIKDYICKSFQENQFTVQFRSLFDKL